MSLPSYTFKGLLPVYNYFLYHPMPAQAFADDVAYFVQTQGP